MSCELLNRTLGLEFLNDVAAISFFFDKFFKLLDAEIFFPPKIFFFASYSQNLLARFPNQSFLLGLNYLGTLGDTLTSLVLFTIHS